MISTSLAEFCGQTIGVDASCWLHRAAYGCARQLALGEPTTQYMNLIHRLTQTLLDHNIRPIFVFDGRPLPAKHDEASARYVRRELSRKAAMEHLSNGNLAAADEQFKRCVTITSKIVREFQQYLSNRHIRFIVAMYEADAQLTYLMKQGMIDNVITEDSDLLAFGCTRLLRRIDPSGQIQLVDLDNVAKYLGKNQYIIMLKRILADARMPLFKNILLEVCVLSGCDYLNSPRGIGIRKALKLFYKLGRSSSVLQCIQANRSLHKLPPNYVNNFQIAVNVFLYQYVFCPKLRKCVHLNHPPAQLNRALSSPNQCSLMSVPSVQNNNNLIVLNRQQSVVSNNVHGKLCPAIHDTSTIFSCMCCNSSSTSTDNDLIFDFVLPSENQIGKCLSDDISCQLAYGLLDPQTLELFEAKVTNHFPLTSVASRQVNPNTPLILDEAADKTDTITQSFQSSLSQVCDSPELTAEVKCISTMFMQKSQAVRPVQKSISAPIPSNTVATMRAKLSTSIVSRKHKRCIDDDFMDVLGCGSSFFESLNTIDLSDEHMKFNCKATAAAKSGSKIPISQALTPSTDKALADADQVDSDLYAYNFSLRRSSTKQIISTSKGGKKALPGSKVNGVSINDKRQRTLSFTNM